MKRKLKAINNYLGFTLIEVMFVVAILGVLSAVAIPAYLGYLRRSYISEAVTGIANTKSAEESYFNMNGCYTGALASPSTTPPSAPTAWPTGTSIPMGWGQNALGVRPDARVRFNYQVYATSFITPADPCGAGTTAAAVSAILDVLPGCNFPAATLGSGGVVVNTVVHPDHWYVVRADGNLNASSVTVNTILVSAIDDSTIFRCNEGD